MTPLNRKSTVSSPGQRIANLSHDITPRVEDQEYPKRVPVMGSVAQKDEGIPTP
jgi:hypothetical protein